MTDKKIDNTKLSPIEERHLKPSEYIGFGSLPEISVKRALKDGYVLNMLCIGETGIGKSVLVNSLFNTNLDSPISTHKLENVKIEINTYNICENDVKIKLTIVDSVGYGDQIDKTDSFNSILNYIDAQFEAYFQRKLKIHRPREPFKDTFIHVCLYVICPTGHGLKANDLVGMIKLHKKVNIIPVIGKADAFTKLELKQFKKNIIKELQHHNVEIYPFLTDDKPNSNVNAKMNNLLPFAVVGSTDFVQIGNKMVRSRVYPWGILEVENEAHTDLEKLKDMLLRTNTEDLRDKTHTKHYEMYRRERLEELGFNDDDTDVKNSTFKKIYESQMPMLRELQEKEEKEEKEQKKQEKENLQKLFFNRIKDVDDEFKKTGKNLFDNFEKTKKKYIQEKEKLIELNKQLNEEILSFSNKKMRKL